LVNSVQRLETVGKLIHQRKFVEAEKALSQSSRDLVRVAKLDAALRPNTSFYTLNLKLLRILLQVRARDVLDNYLLFIGAPTTVTSGHASASWKNIKNCL
jgi:hypothetical protein